MIGLDAQVQHVPIVLSSNFIDKLFKPLCKLSSQYPPSTLRTPGHVVHDEVYGMLFM